jgi:hypothetical protein
MASRQRKWQLKQIEKGLCIYCNKKAIVKGYCEDHYEVRQERTQRWRDRKKEEWAELVVEGQ